MKALRDAAAVLFASLAVGAAADTLTVMPARPSAGEEVEILIGAENSCGPPAFVTTQVYVEALSGTPVIAITTQLRSDVDCAALTTTPIRSLLTLPRGGSYRVDFQRMTPSILRPIQALGPVSVADEIPPAEPAFRNLSGLWWDPTRPGRGLDVSQGESGRLFVFWYTYGEDRAGTWLSLSSGRWISPTEYRGLVYRAHRDNFRVTAYQAYAPLTLRVSSADRLEFRLGDASPQILDRYRF